VHGKVLDPGEDEQERFHLAALRGDDEVDGVVPEASSIGMRRVAAAAGDATSSCPTLSGHATADSEIDTSERPTGDSAKKKCMLSGSEPGPMSRGVVHMMNPPLSVAYRDGPEARTRLPARPGTAAAA